MNTLPELNLWSLAGEILFVLALLVLTLWVLKRFLQRQQHGQNMHVIDTLMVSPRQRINLIRIGDKVIMVGISPNHMQTLSEWDKDEMQLPESRSQTTNQPLTVQSLVEKWNARA